MVVDAAAVAAEALGDMLGGIVEGAVGVGGLAFAAEGEATAGMDIDVAGKEASGTAEGDAGLLGVVEVFAGDLVEVVCHARPERVREFNLLT